MPQINRVKLVYMCTASHEKSRKSEKTQKKNFLIFGPMSWNNYYFTSIKDFRVFSCDVLSFVYFRPSKLTFYFQLRHTKSFLILRGSNSTCHKRDKLSGSIVSGNNLISTSLMVVQHITKQRVLSPKTNHSENTFSPHTNETFSLLLFYCLEFSLPSNIG